MTPIPGYKGPQLPPLPLARNIKSTPQPTGKQDTNLKLAAQQIARNNAMKLARSSNKNQVMQQAMGSTTKPMPAPMAMPRAPMMKKGGKVSSASSRADGCVMKGKTKGRFV